MSAKVEYLSSAVKTGCGTTPGPEPLMTAVEVAAHLGVPRSWVYEKAALNIIPSIKIGAYRRFRWSEIEEWLKEVNA